MWFFPGFSQPDYDRRSPWDQWSPSLPAALLTGLSCAYIWARLKPLVSPREDNKNEYILQDLHNAKSFLTNLWNAKASQINNTEAISKAGEDVLLHRSGARRGTSESVTATLTIAAEREEVERLRRRMGAMARAEQVLRVTEAAVVLLQTRLPVTASLLSQAFEVARAAIALDPGATLQLGSWGVIMQSGGEVKLLRLQDGDAPVLLDSFRDEGEDLRVEGLFLRGVQMRAAMGESSAVTLRSKMLLKADETDALIVWPPLVMLTRASMLYATKIVEFKGVTAVVRSNLIPVSFNAKPKHEDHTGLYLVAALAFMVALMPSALWLPMLGQIGIVFLPVLQMAAVILGWNVGHLLVLGEWPGDREVRLDSEEELKEFGNNLYKYISPWDSAVRMEMGDLERHLARKLEAQPDVSNAGVFAQPADYRTEFWRKGLGEMDQAIEMEPKNDLPFRIRGCIKGLAGNYEGALEDLDQALKLKPDDVLALVDRGVFRFLNGDLVGALADLDQAIKHDPAQPADVLKLRDAIAKILADREELAKLREENPKLKAELEALRAKAAADLEAAQAKAAADLEAAQSKAAADLEAAQAKAAADLKAAQDEAAADLEALRVKAEAEAADLRAKNQKLQEELDKAQEALSKIPSNQTLELQYNNLCCEKCVRDIKSALSKVPGVESVEEDFMTSKVTVTGYISASVILSVCRQTSPRKVIFIVGDQNAPEAAPSIDEEPQTAPEPTAAAPEPKPEPTTPEPAAPAPEPKPETKSEPVPETKPETVPEPAPEAKPETEPAPKEAKPEAAPAPETKPETASEPAPEAKPEAAPAPETKPETASEPAPGAKSEAAPAPETKPETASEPAPQAKSEAAPAPETKPETSSEPAPEEAKPEPAAELASEAKPEPRWEPAPESKAEPTWIADPESRGEGAAVAGEAKAEANGTAEPEVVAAAAAADKPKESHGEGQPEPAKP